MRLTWTPQTKIPGSAHDVHLYVGSAILWGSKFYISIFLGGLGYVDIMDIFWGHHKTGLFLMSFI